MKKKPGCGPAEERLLFFGTSSFSTKDWVGPFYPPGTKPADYLKYYAGRFNTVEIDSSYYAVPSVETVDGWAGKTPTDFIFALKFPASIVHAGEEAMPDREKVLVAEETYPIRDRFLEVAGRLGKKLGPLLLQFPYFSREVFISSKPFFERLDNFLRDLPRDFLYAVEVRNRGWLNEDLAAICRDHGAALVLTDYMSMPLGDEIEARLDPVTADFSYIRLIGNRRQIEAITSHWNQEVIDRSDRLERWAGVVQRLARRRVKTFIYVNNHYAGYAPATLQRLSRLVCGEDWQEAELQLFK
jgi:uncharacterized protein YecE (DUF72 family)